MKNGKHSNGQGNDDITRKGDPIASALAAVALELNAVAQRMQEASRCVRGITGPDRHLAIASVTRALRNAGDGCHDHARSIEEFMRG